MHILKETINHIIKSRVSFSKKLNKTSYNLKIGGKKKKFSSVSFTVRNSLCGYAKYIEFSLNWNVYESVVIDQSRTGLILSGHRGSTNLAANENRGKFIDRFDASLRKQRKVSKRPFTFSHPSIRTTLSSLLLGIVKLCS